MEDRPETRYKSHAERIVISEGLRRILHLMSFKESHVVETPDGKYFRVGAYHLPEGTRKMTVESRLQFEIFGEYPLSKANATEWKFIRPAFRLRKK